MAKGISLRELARKLGVSHKAVQKARDAQRITANPDGTFNLARAKKEWRDNTQHVKRQHGEPKIEAPEEEVEATVAAPKGTPAAAKSTPAVVNGKAPNGLNAAQTRRYELQAEILELELEEKRGRLLDAVEVKGAAFEAARKTRDMIMDIPQRMGPLVAGLTPEQATVALEEECGRICDELAKYGGPSKNGRRKDGGA